jgi:poly(A) polymerase
MMASRPPWPTDSDGTASLAGAAWLTAPATRAVFAALAAAGHEARAVGGCVRNALIGEAVADIDLATPAEPEAVLAAGRAAGLHAVPTGIEHGTVTLVSSGVPHEVTTLREDVETFGRHARVAFTADWAADARRRDFTMNALYCDAEGRVHDPLGQGLADLARRRVRFIGDPHARIREDYLRILRFFRFHATYGDGAIDRAGLAASVAERAGLRQLSAERVGAEFLKLSAAPRVVDAVETMRTHGLLVGVLGVAPRPARLAALVGLERALGLAGEPVLRLAALAVAIPEDARNLATRLRLSGAVRAGLEALADPWHRPSPATTDRALRAAVYRQGKAVARARLLLAATETRMGAGLHAAGPHEAELDRSLARWRAMLALVETWTPPKLPIGGADVLALGARPGPEVGAILAALEARWLGDDFSTDEATLRAELGRLVAGLRLSAPPRP